MKAQALSRLQKEYARILREPVEGIAARPLETDILTWHYVFRGPKDTPFEGGIYHGKIVFPPSYPYAPPGIHIMTPNGCFDTSVKVCLTMSDYHPETWNPLWSVSSILTGLVSHMADPKATMLTVANSDETKRRYARASHKFNLRDPLFKELFPDWAEECEKHAEELAEIVAQDEKAWNCDWIFSKWVAITVVMVGIMYALYATRKWST